MKKKRVQMRKKKERKTVDESFSNGSTRGADDWRVREKVRERDDIPIKPL